MEIKNPWPCILSRVNATKDLGLRTSIGDRYDTNCIIYRCFFPDLTGFITVCCVPSNPDLREGTFTVVTTLKRRFCPA